MWGIMTVTLTKVTQLYRFIRIEFETGTIKTFEREIYTGKLTHQYQLDHVIRLHQDSGRKFFQLLAKRSMFPGTPPKPTRLIAAWTGEKHSEPNEKDMIDG